MTTHAAWPNDRGTSLLEAIAAVALSSLLLSGAMATVAASASEFRRQGVVTLALDLVRTQLETAIALPCLTPPSCPPPFTCRLQREVALLPNLERPLWTIRLRAIVTSPEHEAALGGRVVATTLVARSGPCTTISNGRSL